MTHFAQFTQKYALSKTLRFELKPVGKTQSMLDDNKVFLIDENIKAKYIQTKPFFDKLHRDFIKESFEDIKISGLSGFYEDWKKYRQDKKGTEKDYKKSAENLRREIVSFLDAKWKHWADTYKSSGIKNEDIEVLFEEGIFGILESRYWDDIKSQITDPKSWEITSIFKGWKGSTGYFTKFFETRRNYYKSDGTGTAISTRIVDQNLPRYLENLELFEKIKDKINLEDVRKSFPDFEKIGMLDHYNTCIPQNGIDAYNRLLGWYTKENGEKIKGINESINLYRQTHKEEKIGFLKSLDKQIGSEKIAFMETIDSPEEFQGFLSKYVKESNEKITRLKSSIENFGKFSESRDLEGIFFTQEGFNTISRKWADETNMKLWQEYLYEEMKKSGAKYDSKNDEYKFPDFIALSHMQSALGNIKTEWFFWKSRYLQDEKENPKGFLTLETSLWQGFLEIFSYEFTSLFDRIETDEKWVTKQWGYNIALLDLEKLMSDQVYNPNEPHNKIIIKAFVDETLRVYQMGKYFAIEKRRQWNPDNLEISEWYTHPDSGYESYYSDAYKIIVQWYNDIRNYLTKNPWSEEKYKLNFDHSKLLQWFTESKTNNSNNWTQYGAYILRKKGKYWYIYYLWISKNAHLISYFDESDNSWTSGFERMNYYQIKTNSIYWASYNWTFKEDKEKLPELVVIQKVKEALWNYKERIPEVSEILKKEYSTLKLLQSDIDNLVKEKWKIFQYKELTKNQLEGIEQSKHPMYIFQIYNKDFELDESLVKEGYSFKSQNSTPNSHTLYFQSLASWSQWVIDIWVGEIFFRKKTPKENMKDKKDKSNKTVLDHKRYSQDKILLHLSIILNEANPEVPKQEWGRIVFCNNFNSQINNFLAHNPDINIIGIDRGEKHLAYYSVIDQKGNIITSDSLNWVNDVNYGEKLTDTAERRKQARQDWQAVEGIKNLKKWYISAVVRKLTDLAIEHNAIIIFEDLNMRFKQIRWGIEKSVYQQLEKALIEKLNFLVNKWELDPTKAGHLLNAYQLTAPFSSFQDMGKQTGIIFYTQAAYTSKIDPVTGWRPHLYLKYSSAEQVKNEIKKFTSIIWNTGEKRFEFTYDITNFSNQKEYPENTIWTVCSNIERYRWDKTLNQNKWGYTHYESMTPEFIKLFAEFRIDTSQNILKQISLMDSKWNEKFFKDFIFLFSLVCQIRNTNKKDADENYQDFILSPVVPFFDSRNKANEAKWFPRNGDENGSYNIARKWLMILHKINKFKEENENCDKLGWKELSISQTDWDNFIKNKKS